MEYVYYSTATALSPQPSGESLAIPANEISGFITKTLWKNLTYSRKIKTALFTSNVMSNMVYLPMHKYGSGNSICFEMSFDNPISVGNQMIYREVLFGVLVIIPFQLNMPMKMASLILVLFIL